MFTCVRILSKWALQTMAQSVMGLGLSSKGGEPTGYPNLTETVGWATSWFEFQRGRHN